MNETDVLRTPDARFENIPDFDFQPNYIEVDDFLLGKLRMHYVDEGIGPVILLMHGEPTWSFLYRKMIPPLVEAGFRVIVPDLIGFGRSDKPVSRLAYSYERHVGWLHQFLTGLELKDINLFCQDWGGLTTLRLLAGHSGLFAKVAIANTGLPAGQNWSEAFENWRKFAVTTDTFDAGWITQGATVSELSSAEVDAYNAPFPDDQHLAGARIFPALVPASANVPGVTENLATWKVLASLEVPFLTLFSDKDQVTAGSEKAFKTKIPGAADQPHEIIKNGGHFLQEDVSPELCERLIPFFKQ